MSKKIYTTILTVILTSIIVHIIYKLAGFHYSYAEGILNLKMLIDLGVWLIIFLPINMLLDKILLPKEK